MMPVARFVKEVIPICARLMALVITSKLFAYSVIVAHAPVDAAEHSIKKEFWSKITHHTGRLKSRFPSHRLVILIDANARTNSACGNSIGMSGETRPNDNGFRLASYLDQFSTVAVNTFINGSDNTWAGKGGLKWRIDYVAIEACEAHRIRRCRAYYEVDLATCIKDDHFVVAFDIWSPDDDKRAPDNES